MRILIVFIIILVFAGLAYLFLHSSPVIAPVVEYPGVAVLSDKDIPISQAKTRITKKFFGTFVSPNNSPVSPERFTGYHTGVDFETFSGEENKDISVLALCDGNLGLKEYASGYGGVAIQNCVLNQQAVTVVYGHLKLASISISKGASLKRGDKIGILGKGFSSETDGERKHLHLSIHKGTAITILGYVQKSSELSSWLDPTPFLY